MARRREFPEERGHRVLNRAAGVVIDRFARTVVDPGLHQGVGDREVGGMERDAVKMFDDARFGMGEGAFRVAVARAAAVGGIRTRAGWGVAFVGADQSHART
jgi:hypothetical protein